jgi:hypothetical protein
VLPGTVGFDALEPRGQPAFILSEQNEGDLVTFNPHIHALVVDGDFLPSGTRIQRPTSMHRASTTG